MIDFYTFVFLNLLGLISPGPDFAMITAYGLTGSRKAALLATLGIVTALLVHVFYCVSGVALFLSSAPLALNCIKVLGALYLGYLGLKMLKQEKLQAVASAIPVMGNAFIAGFYTNLLNPKATIFLLSLFSRFASSMKTFNMKMAFALVIPLSALIWFSLLAYFLTHPSFCPFLQKHRRTFMVVMGAALIILSLSGIVSIFI